MQRLTWFCVLAGVALALPLASSSARAEDKRDEFDRLARRLERDARELREEVLMPFREREHYRELAGQIEEIERLAARIHEAKERDERPRRVREILEKLDDAVRKVDREMDELGRNREFDRRAFERAHDEVSDMRRILYRMRKEL
jgi:hypothetical protein